jgi:ELWxxDGT repeat protein
MTGENILEIQYSIFNKPFSFRSANQEVPMFKRLLVLCAILIVFSLTFASIVPGRAQGDQPPKEAITTLYRVADIYAGATGSAPEDLVAYAGYLYFGANGNDGAGRELWMYDPSAGASRVVDIYPGVSSSYPYYLTVYDNSLYFGANGNDGTGRELWRYTTAGGATRLTDTCFGAIGSDPIHLEVYAGELYFAADGCDGAGVELWKYNSTSGVAQRVADINGGAAGSSPLYLAVYNEALYFAADGGDGAGRELWMYDPVNGAQHVEDIRDGAVGSFPSYLAAYNDALYFGADSGGGMGQELWMYDPVNGAQSVADIYFGSGSSNPSYLIAYNGALYFSAYGHDGTGTELWKYDDVNGADRVTDIYLGNAGSLPAYLAIYNGSLYFQANGNDGAGAELWTYGNSSVASFRSVKSLDGWVLESGETTNVGGTLNSGAVTFSLGDDALDRQYRAILSFDTSSLPDAAVVTGVILNIRRQGIVGVDPFIVLGNIRIDIRNGAFSNNSVLQAADFQATASRNNVGTIQNLPDANNWYMTKLLSTAYININPTGVTQFRLRFSTDDNDDRTANIIRFFSSDVAVLSNRPILVLLYYAP